MTTTATMLGQSSSLSPFAGPYVGDMLGKGAALASMPYQAYMGPLSAGQSQLQNQAFSGLANLAVPQASMAGSFYRCRVHPTYSSTSRGWSNGSLYSCYR